MSAPMRRHEFPNGGTQEQKAAWWGEEAATAIRKAVATPDPQTIEDLWLLHAVRATRLAAYHALKARPRLKAPRRD